MPVMPGISDLKPLHRNSPFPGRPAPLPRSIFRASQNRFVRVFRPAFARRHAHHQQAESGVWSLGRPFECSGRTGLNGPACQLPAVRHAFRHWQSPGCTVRACEETTSGRHAGISCQFVFTVKGWQTSTGRRPGHWTLQIFLPCWVLTVFYRRLPFGALGGNPSFLLRHKASPKNRLSPGAVEFGARQALVCESG